MGRKVRRLKRKSSALEDSERPRKKGKVYVSESDSDAPRVVSSAANDSEKGEDPMGHATEDDDDDAESSEESQDTDDMPLPKLHRIERRKSARRARGKAVSNKEPDHEPKQGAEGDDSAKSTHTQAELEGSQESQTSTPDEVSDEEGDPKSRKKCNNCARKNKTCKMRSGFDSCAPCHFAKIECRFPFSRNTFIMDEAYDYGTNLEYAG